MYNLPPMVTVEKPILMLSRLASDLKHRSGYIQHLAMPEGAQLLR
jgi:hypothetical protein